MRPLSGSAARFAAGQRIAAVATTQACTGPQRCQVSLSAPQPLDHDLWPPTARRPQVHAHALGAGDARAEAAQPASQPERGPPLPARIATAGCALLVAAGVTVGGMALPPAGLPPSPEALRATAGSPAQALAGALARSAPSLPAAKAVTSEQLLFLEAWRAIDRAYVDKGFNGQAWFRVSVQRPPTCLPHPAPQHRLAATCLTRCPVRHGGRCSRGGQVREAYLKKEPMETREQTYAAIEKLVASLDDPFTR